MLNKIVHLTSVHPVQDVRIYKKECSSVAAAGFEVVLVAATEHAPEGPFRVRAVEPSHSRLERVTRVLWDVYRTAVDEAADLYHLHDPELIPVGLRLRARGAKVVYDAHEDVAKQVLGKPWIPRHARPIVSGAVRTLLRRAARQFDGIVTATPDIATLYPASKTVVVRNYPIVSDGELPAGHTYRIDDPYIVYVGALYETRGVREMVEIARLVQDSGVRFVVAGPIQDDVSRDAIEAGQTEGVLEYLGPIPHEQVLPLMASALAGLVLLHPEPRFLTSYPVKLFEYMAAATPVLASDFPLFREIVEGSASGYVVDPLDPTAAAVIVRELVGDPASREAMGKRGRDAVLDHYNWGPEADRLVEFYTRILS